MAGDLDFYFDFSSPYGYFAAMRIDDLAAKYQRTVHWRPVLLGVVFKTTGGMPLPMIPIKGGYSLHDFARSARFHGIAYKQPAMFPISTQAAARATLWLQENVGVANAIEFAKAVYRGYFADGIDICDSANLLQIANGIGLDGAAVVEGGSSPAIKEKLRTDIEQAMQRGVFGSPFIIVDGESFWGFDRFDQIEALLKNGII